MASQKKPKVYVVPLEDLNQDPENGNAGTERGQSALQHSVKSHKLGRGVLLDRNNYLIGGNKTHQAASQAGAKGVIVVESDGDYLIATKRTDLDLLKDPEARALAWADNRIQELNYDPNLEQLFKDLDQGVDLSPYFSDAELQKYLDILEAREPDDEEEDSSGPAGNGSAGKPYEVEKGQIWEVGYQRLICGDCAEPEVWERLLQGQKYNLCVTSPPYADKREYDQEQDDFEPIPAAEYVTWFYPIHHNLQQHIANDGSLLLNIKEHSVKFIRQLHCKELVFRMGSEWGWEFLDEYIWSHSGVPGDPHKMGKLKNMFEPIYWFAKVAQPKFFPEMVQHQSDQAVLVSPNNRGLMERQGHGGAMTGEVVGEGWAYPGNVLQLGRNRDNDDSGQHPAVFPQNLPTFFIKLHTKPDEIVVDPFCGSGTTLLACHAMNRAGYGIERSPKYCETILRRLAKEMETEPQLIED